ncbi:hypothetical protein E2C01_010324 [Portunus trituberculatus]|uniref:Uncharacterized protein n=1 Tax=Portunus trituberculatus TaxID=210409 RepID=A0A5B7D8D3_PORTR|nr:hypothetical protein [Portunus trituberculatus]
MIEGIVACAPPNLTMLADHLAATPSSCSGLNSGALIPVLTAMFSTYHAEPMPAKSLTVLPSAAAAMVLMPRPVPIVRSM